MALEYVGGAVVNGGLGPITAPLTGLSGGIDTAARAGDLVIVAAGCVSTADRVVSVETPGYTELAELYSDSSGRDTNLGVFWKYLTEDETGVSASGSAFSSSGAGIAVHVWRGSDPASPIDVAVETATGINTRGMNSPAITPVTPGAVVLSIGAAVAGANFNSTSFPAGYTNRVFQSADPGTAFGVGIASREWDGTTPEDPPVWGSTGGTSGDSWAAVTVVLRPAAMTGDVTGAVEATEGGGDTASGAATVDTAGIAETQDTGADTAAAAGFVGIAAALAATGGGTDLATMAGAVAWPGLTGAMAADETAGDAIRATGAVAVAGGLASAETGADALVASGTVTASGVVAGLAATETGPDTASAGASAGVGGAVAAADGSDTGRVIGSLPIGGALAASDMGDTARASIRVDIGALIQAVEAQADSFAALIRIASAPRFTFPGDARGGRIIGAPRGGTITRG